MSPYRWAHDSGPALTVGYVSAAASERTSEMDGLGRMCKPHWNQYTNALRKAALARKAAEGEAPAEVASTEPETVAVAAPKAVGGRKTKESRTPRPEPIRTRVARRRLQATPEAGSQGDAG